MAELSALCSVQEREKRTGEDNTSMFARLLLKIYKMDCKNSFNCWCVKSALYNEYNIIPQF